VPRPAWQRAIELVLVVAASALVAALAVRVLSAGPAAVWAVPAGLVLGVLAADFASGVLHWFCDSFFCEKTPVIGPMLIAPFREHHDDPEGMLHHGVLELHGNSCIPVIAVLALAQLAIDERAGGGWLLFQSWLLFFTTSAMATNQFHKWAHDEHARPAVRWLQRRGLILSPERHGRHHRGSFRQSYCTTTGWLNTWLDRIDFFPRLERRIRARAKPEA
jgi:ubiquitin-conjugating enzyme E2 variant